MRASWPAWRRASLPCASPSPRAVTCICATAFTSIRAERAGSDAIEAARVVAEQPRFEARREARAEHFTECADDAVVAGDQRADGPIAAEDQAIFAERGERMFDGRSDVRGAKAQGIGFRDQPGELAGDV